jgi:probable rRNA maturation factor
VRLSLIRHSRCGRKRIAWLDRRTKERLERTAASLAPAGDVDLIVADDEFLQELNRNYRGIDRPTDVLSFSYLLEGTESAPEAGAIAQAGEVYVSYETVEQDAQRDGVPPEHLFLRVGVHGLLHVIGYDHVSRRGAIAMESEEKRLLLEYLNPSEVEELF